ncbi:hypothetical protein RUM43_013534 [Polyplax serrata]|uniref:Zinc transporter ZIP11 n=1 Tax=Polyplax serrata TaxID=468196 RepID=A0AAN8PS63_POLSC
MISNLSPLVQAGLGTLFTWSLTAAGAAVVVIFSGSQMKLLHASLGFAAGVMLSASYWSLLSPAIEMAEQSNYYGVNGEYAFLPVTVGFLFGGLFVYLTDLLISSFGICVPQLLLVVQKDEHKQIKKDILMQGNTEQHMALGQEDSHDADENNFELGNFKGTATESHCRSLFTNSDPSNLNQRDRHGNSAFSTTGLGIPRPRSFGKNCPKPNKNKRPASIAQGLNVYENSKDPISNKEEQTELTSDSQAALTGNEHSSDKWKRIVLLIIAITVHNIPEGLAVGVGFGAIGSTPSATFESAR